MNLTIEVLRPWQKIFILFIVVGLKCLKRVLQLATESKQIKAWPEFTNGFIVSSISYSSYFCICFSNAFLFLNELGTSIFCIQFGFKTVISTRQSFKSCIFNSISSYLVKSGMISTDRTLPTPPGCPIYEFYANILFK